MSTSLCKRVRGCCHPPNHLGVCEVDRPVPRGRGAAVDLAPVDSFLDQQERTAQLAARVADELLIVVGAQSAIFEGGLTREGLIVLVAAKCGRAKNGSRLTEDTVGVVLDGLANIGDFLVTPAVKR